MFDENPKRIEERDDRQPTESMERREFLGLTFKWSSAALAALVLLVRNADEAEAGSWVNRRGGGGWINRGGGWINRGGSWVNRGGGGWINRRGGGGWINRR